MSKENKQTISKQLAKCPLCGEEIKGGVRLTGYIMMNRQYIKCDACGLKMESSYDIDGLSQTHLKAITEDLIRRWNTRKPMERIVERLEEYEGTYVDVDIVRGIIKEEGEMNE